MPNFSIVCQVFRTMGVFPSTCVCFSPKSRKIGTKCVNTYSIVHNVINYTLETLIMYLCWKTVSWETKKTLENQTWQKKTILILLHMYSINLTITLAQNQWLSKTWGAVCPWLILKYQVLNNDAWQLSFGFSPHFFLILTHGKKIWRVLKGRAVGTGGAKFWQMS